MKTETVPIEVDKKTLRVFFASDVHGSEVCFKKFLNAGKFYEADIIILGGDLSGKLVVPIIRQGEHLYQTNFQERLIDIRGENKLKEIFSKIRFTGSYYIVLDRQDAEEYAANEKKKDQLFIEVLKKSISEWVALAEERLNDTPITCLILPGNDDPKEIDQILEKSGTIINPEGKLIEINETYEIISTGYGNITPWNCPRDVPEEELEEKVNRLCLAVRNFKTSIFNFHVPPYDSTLDLAPKLDESLKVITEMGHPVMIPVGSKAIRKAIEEHQPMLGLHGHIHESRGTYKLGNTLCINPGSEYSEGILHGVIIDLKDGKIKNYVLTTG